MQENGSFFTENLHISDYFCIFAKNFQVRQVETSDLRDVKEGERLADSVKNGEKYIR